MVCSLNGLKYGRPAWVGLGEAVDGRLRAGIPLGGDFVSFSGGGFGGLAADAVAIAAAVVGAVGGGVGRRR